MFRNQQQKCLPPRPRPLKLRPLQPRPPRKGIVRIAKIAPSGRIRGEMRVIGMLTIHPGGVILTVSMAPTRIVLNRAVHVTRRRPRLRPPRPLRLPHNVEVISARTAQHGRILGVTSVTGTSTTPRGDAKHTVRTEPTHIAQKSATLVTRITRQPRRQQRPRQQPPQRRRRRPPPQPLKLPVQTARRGRTLGETAANGILTTPRGDANTTERTEQMNIARRPVELATAVGCLVRL